MELNRRQAIGAAVALATGGIGANSVAGEATTTIVRKLAPLILVIDRNGNRAAWDEALELELSELPWSSPVVWRHFVDYVDHDSCKDPEVARQWSEVRNWDADRILDAKLDELVANGRWEFAPESLANSVRERMIYDVGSRVLGVIACGDHPLDLVMAGGATTLAGSGFVSTHWAGRFGCLDWQSSRWRDCIHERPENLPLSSLPEIARRVVRRLHLDARSEHEAGSEYWLWETFNKSYWA